MNDVVSTPISGHVRMGSSVGQPLARVEGRLKVTGAAGFAADTPDGNVLHAVIAVSTVARGKIAALDVAAARAHPGVVAVMTHENRPTLAMDPDTKDHLFMMRLDLLQNDRVRYANQPVAVVIAETLEAAMEGTTLLRPRFEA